MAIGKVTGTGALGNRGNGAMKYRSLCLCTLMIPIRAFEEIEQVIIFRISPKGIVTAIPIEFLLSSDVLQPQGELAFSSSLATSGESCLM